MSTDDDHGRRPETPRYEPEIIPPDRNDASEGPIFIHIDQRDGVRRVTFKRPGLFSIVLGIVALGLIAALVLLLVAGVLLFWIPIVAGAIILALLYASIRYRWRLLQDWWAGRR
jgi:hypothetical protein